MSRDADPAGHARPTREELEASQKALLESEARLREMNAELARHVTERTAASGASTRTGLRSAWFTQERMPITAYIDAA